VVVSNLADNLVKVHQEVLGNLEILVIMAEMVKMVNLMALEKMANREVILVKVRNK